MILKNLEFQSIKYQRAETADCIELLIIEKNICGSLIIDKKLKEIRTLGQILEKCDLENLCLLLEIARKEIKKLK